MGLESRGYETLHQGQWGLGEKESRTKTRHEITLPTSLSIIKSDTKKVSLEKWLENGGRKPLVWEDGVEIGEKHKLQLDYCENGDDIL